MSLKAALIALFAASAIATPTQLTRRAGGKYLDDQEEYERAKARVPNLGWCTFHIHEDWPTGAASAFGVSLRKVEMHLFDASEPDPALIYYDPQRDISFRLPYTFTYEGLPHQLVTEDLSPED
ncbi:hypothetical protein DL765_006769 [Monosporascus sp. GIB2]|nr:hypothetical protein DL765_006769 [Monosporascus sp. GIB2]